MLLRWLSLFALCALLGCGDDGGGNPGGTPDGGEQPEPDTGEEPSAEGPCSVQRTGPATSVVFHDADGQPLATVETVDGEASYDSCVENGMVTALVPPMLLGGGGGTQTRLFTVQGVMPGDTVVLDPPFDQPEQVGPVNITVENEVDQVTTGADPDKYVASVGECTSQRALDDSTGGSFTVTNMQNCLGNDPASYSVVSIARNADNEPVGFARLDSSDFTDPVLDGGEWVAYDGPQLISVANGSASASNVSLEFSGVIDGVVFGTTDADFEPEDDAVEAHYWPSGIADSHRVAVAVEWPDEVFGLTRVRTPTVLETLDLADLLFEPMSTLVVDVSDAARPQYVWQGGDARAVITRTEITWTDGADSGSWGVVVPGNPGRTVVPVLPDELADQGPSETATKQVGLAFQADKGIDYAQWLEEGLSTYAGLLVPEIFFEVEGTFRLTGFMP